MKAEQMPDFSLPQGVSYPLRLAIFSSASALTGQRVRYRLS